MGLIKAVFTAGKSSFSSTLEGQWKEYFSVDSMEKDVLMCRGVKVVHGKSANRGQDNVISDGSGISIADGQCAIIVEQGKVVELCAESGVFTYNNTTAPSIFTGDLGDGVRNSFQTMFTRFTMGGGTTGTDQRVYYFNLKEIMENRYGTATPIPFRVVGRNHSFDLDTSVKCNGQYSYRIVDPLLFYMNVCGNVSTQFRRNEIDSTLKSEVLTALQPALGQISAKGIRYSDLPSHTIELTDALNQVLTRSWVETRGIKIVSFGMNSVTIPQEDAEQIRQLQLYETPHLAGANLAAAQADALRNASSNTAGAMHGFVGMNMAGAMGNVMNGMNQGMNGMNQGMNGMNQGMNGMNQGMNGMNQGMNGMSQGMNGMNQGMNGMNQGMNGMNQGMNGMNQGMNGMNQGMNGMNQGTNDMNQGANGMNSNDNGNKPIESGWSCACGTSNEGKFCSNCGGPKPTPPPKWQCSCLTPNTGKFCRNCGEPQPTPSMGWICPCGATNPGNFCQDCGKPQPSNPWVYRCDKCGYNPPNPENPPKFCPECGDNFNIQDRIEE